MYAMTMIIRKIWMVPGECELSSSGGGGEGVSGFLEPGNVIRITLK